MTKFKKQVFSALATGAIFASMITPAFADTEIVINHNAADSNSTANVDISHNQTIVQNNTAVVTNNISTTSKTGNNTADKNNGDVLVSTGNVSANTSVNNTLNLNTARIDCCNDGNTTVNISDNGADSRNKAYVDVTKDNSIYQNNTAVVDNNVDTNSYTGENKASKNNGNTTIVSGDVDTSTNVSTRANLNSAVIGGGSSNGSGDVSAYIVHNSADSYNKINLDVNKENLITQDNVAVLSNDIYNNAYTGKNKADKNNGDVWVQSGDVSSMTDVLNDVNANFAALDCGCDEAIFAKIKDNGADTENKINAYLDGGQSVYQDGVADLANNVDNSAYTGKNQAKKNNGTGLPGDPTVVVTGDVDSSTSVENRGNVNVVGQDLGFDLPDWGSDLHVSFSLNLADLLPFLHGIL